jgi:photosystem II stability/assembly factor-like uncharacterized protein
MMRLFRARQILRATFTLAFAVVLLLPDQRPAGGHDASAYGGVFRTRNMGAVWLNADIGLFLNAPLAVAVDPHDPSQLLLGTELGLLHSENAGRSWRSEARESIVGPVFALAYVDGGTEVLCVTPNGAFRGHSGAWQSASVPDGATPARVVVAGDTPGRVYLVSRAGLFASNDGGRSFAVLESDLPSDQPATALAIVHPSAPRLIAAVGGRLMSSGDDGRHWQAGSLPGHPATIEAIDADPAIHTRAWAAGDGRLFRSDDAGANWVNVGDRLPDAHTIVRGIAADASGRVIVVSTDRGLYRSETGGSDWLLKEGNLPVHLESGPLFRDPSDERVLYAVFSLLPYSEVWRSALAGVARRQPDPRVIAACVGFLFLLIGAGLWLVRLLSRGRTRRALVP